MSRVPFLILAMIATVLGLAGCQTETVQSGPHGAVMSAPTVMSPSQGPVVDSTPSSAKPARANSEFEGLNAATDPCAARLQDICGAMLMAYAMNKSLPGTLDELQPYANGVTLNFNCPVSGQRYVYVPGGLRANKVRDVLMVYDDEPVHHGDRWGIVMSPAQPNTAVTMYVIPLNDKLFKAYQGK